MITAWVRTDLEEGTPTYLSGFCNRANPADSHQRCPETSPTHQPCQCICHDPEVDIVDNPGIPADARQHVAEARTKRQEIDETVKVAIDSAARAKAAAEGDSNDDEIEALQEALDDALQALDVALGAMGMELPGFSEADKADETEGDE